MTRKEVVATSRTATLSAERPVTMARQARIAAGVTIAEAARLLQCSQERVRLAERAGGRCSFNTARDLARLYHCDQMAFLTIGR